MSEPAVNRTSTTSGSPASASGSYVIAAGALATRGAPARSDSVTQPLPTSAAVSSPAAASAKEMKPCV